MFCLQTIIVILITSFPSGLMSTTVTYEELEEIDGTCPNLDSCAVRRNSDSLDKYTCHCGPICSKLRTCCVDSPHRDTKLPGRRPACRHVNDEYEHYYFMVDTCSSSHKDMETDKDMETLCKEEPTEQDNLIPFVPVTSLSTNVTYKNYYCFKCNEVTDDFIFWNVKVNANSSSDGVKAEDAVLTYDTTDKTWTASVGETGKFIPVTLFIEIPSKIKTVAQICIPGVVYTCSGKWSIQDVRRKCSMYTSFVFVIKEDGNNIRYRNPHCALCNFESLEKMGCGNPISSRSSPKEIFSFSMLLDINPSDGKMVGKVQRCDNKSIWDSKFKKCRRLTCLRKDHVVKDGKCVAP